MLTDFDRNWCAVSWTLHINFYQNRSSIVKVMIKKFWCVFYASQCIQVWYYTVLDFKFTSMVYNT